VTVVLVHDEGKGYEVEFMTLDGETIAVVTLRAVQVRAVQYDEIAHDLPPLNSTASRERIWGWSKPREATNATRKEGTG